MLRGAGSLPGHAQDCPAEREPLMSRPRGSAHELVTAVPAMGAAQARIRLWHHPDPNRLPYFYSSNVQKGHRSVAIKASPNAKQSP